MIIAWIILITATVLAFILFESYALATGRTTLSRLTWDTTRRWPPLPFVVGLIVGFLASHFWWGGSLICY